MIVVSYYYVVAGSIWISYYSFIHLPIRKYEITTNTLPKVSVPGSMTYNLFSSLTPNTEQIFSMTYLTFVAELLVEYCARIAFSFPFHLSRSLAISPASAHGLMLCTFIYLSAVLRQVSLGRPQWGRDSFYLLQRTVTVDEWNYLPLYNISWHRNIFAF